MTGEERTRHRARGQRTSIALEALRAYTDGYASATRDAVNEPPVRSSLYAYYYAGFLDATAMRGGTDRDKRVVETSPLYCAMHGRTADAVAAWTIEDDIALWKAEQRQR